MNMFSKNKKDGPVQQNEIEKNKERLLSMKDKIWIKLLLLNSN